MLTKRSLFQFSLAASLLLLPGCPGDDVSNPTTTLGDDTSTGGDDDDDDDDNMTTVGMTMGGDTTMGMDTTGDDDDDDTTGDDDDDDTTTTGDDDDDDTTTTGDDDDDSSTTAGEESTSDTGDMCGNDMVDGAEVCDGTDLDGETCVTQGFDGGTLACADDCNSFDTTACTMDSCGNDMIDGTDVCDGTDLGGETCVTQGFDGGTLACAVDCSAYDTSGCTMDSCGNDMIDGTDVCDGTDLGGETCETQGFAGGMLACAMDCMSLDTSGCFDFEGDCCADNGTPGCDDAGCTAAICAADAFCCDTEWDATCAAAALVEPACQGVGGSCPDVFEGDCCAANGTPGCDDPTCTATICAADAFCCDSQWDMTCANAALMEPDCQGVGGSCPDVFEGDCCAANGTPGCDDAGCTAAICAADAFCCDTQWDMTCANAALMEPACQGVGGSCPAVFEGDCCAANGTPGCDDAGCTAAICAADAFCCDTQWDMTCANAAIMEPACQGVGGSCPAVFEGDCCAANGTPGCDDPTCTATICAADAFCCDSQWDMTCANAALMEPDCENVGGSCPTTFEGDCCASNGTPGCDDAGCTAAICAVDAFCCDNTWDMTCANAAIMEPACQGVGGSCPGGGFAGDCCASNGSAGCVNAACTAAICAADAFCCDNTWDLTCANAAAIEPDCVGADDTCAGDGDGDCCASNGSPGCDNNVCEAAVCAADAFCCDNTWDGVCGTAATGEPACANVIGTCA